MEMEKMYVLLLCRPSSICGPANDKVLPLFRINHLCIQSVAP